MTAKPAPADQVQEAAKLAAATFELWQEQWRLLAGDAEAQQNIQMMLELLGRNTAFWDGQFKTAGGVGNGAAKNSPAAHPNTRATSGATTAAPASGTSMPGLAQLAAAVAELAAKIDRIEQRLESQTSPKPGRAPRPRRETSA